MVLGGNVWVSLATVLHFSYTLFPSPAPSPRMLQPPTGLDFLLSAYVLHSNLSPSANI